jgi:hypothetical protein
MSTLFYDAGISLFDLQQLTLIPEIVAVYVDPLGPCTQIDLADGVPDDWELGVPFLAGMDEVRVETARLDLRGLRVSTTAEGWSCVPQSKGWKITLAQPARLVSITFDAPEPDPAFAGQTLRAMLSPAAPAGPPMFIDPAFALGSAYANLPPGMSQHDVFGGRIVARIPPTLGTSWLLQWGVGDDATTLAPVPVTTTVRAVTIERAVAGARLELRPDESGGEPVLVWSHPGVLDPASGLQPVDLAPISRKRLNDRLAAANAASTPPPTLTLPVRLVAEAGGPVGVSGTDLRVTYAVDAAPDTPRLALRGEPLPLDVVVPAALRPAAGTLSISATHLGRELNGPVGRTAGTGGPGVVVSGDRWAARALPVVDGGTGATVAIAATTIDVSADAGAELSIELRADIQGLPGPVLATAVLRFDDDVRAVRELTFDAPPMVAADGVVWVTARATTGAVRWYADEEPNASTGLPGLTMPLSRTSSDRGETWAPHDDRLTGRAAPRARLLHAVDPPYAVPMLEISAPASLTTLAALALAPADGTTNEFALDAAAVPGALLDHAGRTSGQGKTTSTMHVAARAALDLRITGFDLTYPPTAGPTGS